MPKGQHIAVYASLFNFDIWDRYKFISKASIIQDTAFSRDMIYPFFILQDPDARDNEAKLRILLKKEEELMGSYKNQYVILMLIRLTLYKVASWVR